MEQTQTQSVGFTLIEILITISIVGIIGILLAQVFFTTTKVNTKTELQKDIRQNGQFALDVMSRMIRSAIEVTSTCDTTGTQSTSIQITNPDGDMTTFECLYADSVSRIASTSASTGQSSYLTSKNVTLGGTSCNDADMTLLFTCQSGSSQTPFVTLQFDLMQKGAGTNQTEQANQSFQLGVNVRNSY
jgi:prepilin-type N-terminal cleavage/methylation domain-containing protein